MQLTHVANALELRALKIVPLTQGFVTTVDDADYAWIRKQKWCYSGGRAVGWDSKQGRVRLLHRIILQAPRGTIIDHTDGNPLNNQRSNLRFTNCSLNIANSRAQRNRRSQYKGVSTHRLGGWRAYIKVNYHFVTGGLWDAERDAALAYDVLALRHFGDFARLNFPKATKLERDTIETRMGEPKRVRRAWSRFLGVSFAKSKNRWQAYVDSDGRRVFHKSHFKSEIEAARARDTFIRVNRITAKLNYC